MDVLKFTIMACISQKVMVDKVRNNRNQVQETIIDWYQVLEPVYKAQEKALVEVI